MTGDRGHPTEIAGCVSSLHALFLGNMGNREMSTTHPTKAQVSKCPGVHRSGGYGQLMDFGQKRLSRGKENSSELAALAHCLWPSKTPTSHPAHTVSPEPPPQPTARTHPARNYSGQLFWSAISPAPPLHPWAAPGPPTER